MYIAENSFTRPNITLHQARQIAGCAFGERGKRIVDLWKQYNTEYFGEGLKPVPIILVPVSPYGHWYGLCCGTSENRTALIYLMSNLEWDQMRAILLHEMIHQKLFEDGEAPSHESGGWRREIMRISEDYFGKPFWAGKYTVKKVRDADGRRRSVRANQAGPNGEDSISQREIASWPTSLGLVAPDLK